ncbi:hypothetical protein, partial [Aeromonas sobria]|uniref:hypothetical protein n=1 Tax=Aeromonas sobria TaxID=646 RepID=UPI0019D6499C
VFGGITVMTHSSTGYLSSEAACYAAVKVVGVQHFPAMIVKKKRSSEYVQLQTGEDNNMILNIIYRSPYQV